MPTMLKRSLLALATVVAALHAPATAWAQATDESGPLPMVDSGWSTAALVVAGLGMLAFMGRRRLPR